MSRQAKIISGIGTVTALGVAAWLIFRQTYDEHYSEEGYMMMYGPGGWWWLMMILMLVFWGLVVWAIVYWNGFRGLITRPGHNHSQVSSSHTWCAIWAGERSKPLFTSLDQNAESAWCHAQKGTYRFLPCFAYSVGQIIPKGSGKTGQLSRKQTLRVTGIFDTRIL